jgi:FHS family glucose/mannose:H+ symporter-like MFS transporter
MSSISPVGTPSPYSRVLTRTLTSLAHGGIFIFGIVMALVGAIVPALQGRVSITLAEIGTLFLVMNFGMLMASVVVGLVVDRLGLKAPLALGAALVGGGLLVIAAAQAYGSMLAAAICVGFGGGALNAVTNTLVADLHDDEREKAAALNLLGVFFGFGALLMPFSVGALTARFGLAPLLGIGAGLCLAVATVAAALSFPAPKQLQGWPFAHMPRFLKMPMVRALAVLLFFESGNEFLLGGYISTFLTRELDVALGEASYLLAAFWGAIMLARFVLSRAGRGARAETIVLVGSSVAALGALIIAFAPSAAVAAFGILVTGLALAGIFPSVLAFAGARFSAHSGTVFGILFAIALCGGMTIPWAAGWLAQATGVRWVFVFAAANFAAVGGFMSAARRVP